MRKADLAIFVEDPGAANFALALPEGIRRILGLEARIFASGAAVDYLKAKGIEFATPSELRELKDFRALLLGTSEQADSASFQWMDQAKRVGIPSISFLDGPMNVETRFSGTSGKPFHHVPDHLLVNDEASAVTARKYGFSSERIHVVGHPYFEWVLARRKSFRRKPVFPPRTVAFFAEPNAGLVPADVRKSGDYSLHGRGESTARTDIVLEEWLDSMKPYSGKVNAILRLHPKNGPSDFARYASSFAEQSQGGDAIELIERCDAVFGITSMVIAEAALLGRPTLAVIPRAVEKDWLPSIGWGLTKAASTRQSLHRLVREMMEATSAAPEPDYHALVGLNSLERIADTLRGILGERH